jgi:penicillin-binding protein 1C
MQKKQVSWISFLLTAAAVLTWYTWVDLQPLPNTIGPLLAPIQKVQMLDRYDTPLSITFQNPWNVHHHVPLHAIPTVLQQTFILAEDQRFYQHRGVDWLARVQALVQNLRARRGARGASTITEQVVRLLHPRPRTLWSRWLETFEAVRLEQRFSKGEILAFYLNQVPYARQRRGVVQAAHDYFDRDLDTLNVKEMLALAVLVRAPSRFDLRRNPERLEPSLVRLAQRMHAAQLLSGEEYTRLLEEKLVLARPALSVQADHFLRYVTGLAIPPHLLRHGRLHTTLDASLQGVVQAILDSRLHDLRASHVANAAALVVDHQTNQVLAWVNAGDSQIDAITTPRQPGSTLKPFLYALALEQGWTAATLIDDAPLAQAIGTGLHTYHNYSGQHYGPLRLREALGNSLNIPAVQTLGMVGTRTFLECLHHLGFTSLRQSPDHYSDGLALGNGEVTLFELVQAYAALARHGIFRPLALTPNLASPELPRRVYRAEVSSLIANILADPQARRLEFGNGNLLRFPVETAVKTGTSTDYRDAWTLGFSHRYTVGVWMGNVDGQPMQDITGSIGPALALRAIFAELNRYTTSHPLYLSPALTSVTICRLSGQRATPNCPPMQEWFLPSTAPMHLCVLHQPVPPSMPEPVPPPAPVQLLQPTPGLQLAMDPRLPDAREAFPFILPTHIQPQQTRWIVDGQQVGETGADEHQLLWPLARGEHTVQAHIWLAGQAQPVMTHPVTFVVK